MTGEAPDPHAMLHTTAAVFEGALNIMGDLAAADPQTLAAIHDGAAEAIVGGAAAESPEDPPEVVGRRVEAYILTLVMTERAADMRDPHAQPPASQVLRSAARAKYPDLDRYMSPAAAALSFIAAQPEV